MKKKFNIIDLVIVLVIVAVTAAVIMILGVKEEAPKNAQTRTVVVEIRQKSENFCNAPQEGDIITNATTKKEIGTLVKKEVVPAKNVVTSTEEGKFVNSDIPGYYDLYLTINLHTDIDAAKIGKSLYIQSHKYACSGFVVDVPENEEVSK